MKPHAIEFKSPLELSAQGECTHTRTTDMTNHIFLHTYSKQNTEHATLTLNSPPCHSY